MKPLPWYEIGRVSPFIIIFIFLFLLLLLRKRRAQSVLGASPRGKTDPGNEGSGAAGGAGGVLQEPRQHTVVVELVGAGLPGPWFGSPEPQETTVGGVHGVKADPTDGKRSQRGWHNTTTLHLFLFFFLLFLQGKSRGRSNFVVLSQRTTQSCFFSSPFKKERRRGKGRRRRDGVTHDGGGDTRPYSRISSSRGGNSIPGSAPRQSLPLGPYQTQRGRRRRLFVFFFLCHIRGKGNLF
jgi:hypothetical protein